MGTALNISEAEWSLSRTADGRCQWQDHTHIFRMFQCFFVTFSLHSDNCVESTFTTHTASVGDELSCPASVRLVEVRPCHSTSPSTALVDGSGANRFQARSPCLQVSAAPSYLADELRQPTDCDAWRRLRSASSPLMIVRRTRLSACQPSAIEFSRSLLPVFGTVCRTTSRRHHLWLSSAVASRRTSLGTASHNAIPLLCLRSDTRHCRTH